MFLSKFLNSKEPFVEPLEEENGEIWAEPRFPGREKVLSGMRMPDSNCSF